MTRLLLLLPLAACGGSNYPPDLPLDPVYTTCEVVDDCVVVELGCCDDCNGGLAVAVNKDAQQEVIDTFSEKCGNNQGCTLMGCPPFELSCTEGTCTAERGDFTYGTETP